MTEPLLAKTILKNKFWIVEDSTNNKIATIQAIDDGGFVFVKKTLDRQKYPSIKLLSADHNIVFDKLKKPKEDQIDYQEIYGFPIGTRPFNVYWDVKNKFAVYTKNSKSKSYFCAGYYAIKFNDQWVKAFCPKLITINRYQFKGPFKDKLEALEQLKILNQETTQNGK